ncbi:uncharacterized protein LOC123546919 isoform X2 [Mercenaria mercenaria]|uniref:uncharacterized protein LOC123546919 isoform X2 n=1 Tax=Mercenaria mercenaria TaxID=6596 RepID=UPI00234E7055|nr:uncharacterized protein LOC123546919 isoform X2 [Mercenaria mercenaria]
MEKRYSKFLYKVIATLIYVCVVSASPVKRSTAEFSGPCFALSEEGPSDPRPLNESLIDLKERTHGLSLKAQQLKEYLAERHQYSDVTVNNLDDMNWMDKEEMLATDEQKEAAVLEPMEALKSHMLLLAEHLLYVSQARTVGAISEKKSEEETRGKLLDYATELESCMCSLKIALLSGGYNGNSSVSDEVLDSNFTASSSPLLNATYRTYVTMQDAVDLMEFLNTIYDKIELSLDDTEA